MGPTVTIEHPPTLFCRPALSHATLEPAHFSITPTIEHG